MSRTHETQQLVRKLRKLGCEVTPTKKGHFKVLTPSGGTCTLSGTPSDFRSMKNQLAQLKKAGIVLD